MLFTADISTSEISQCEPRKVRVRCAGVLSILGRNRGGRLLRGAEQGSDKLSKIIVVVIIIITITREPSPACKSTDKQAMRTSEMRKAKNRAPVDMSVSPLSEAPSMRVPAG
jgi:hypothetical protein